MGTDHRSYGRGPRELTGAVDLVSYYKLFPHHDFFCKRSLPMSISDTHYLYNVVGNAEIRKGEGMQFDQLIQNNSLSQETDRRIRPFELDILGEAFRLRDTNPVDLPPSETGIPTAAAKSINESEDKEKRRKKDKEKDRYKDREHKKHKHQHKDRSKDKDKRKKKDKHGHPDSSNDHKIEKKRKQNGNEDGSSIQKQKKSKHRSSKIDEKGAIR